MRAGDWRRGMLAATAGAALGLSLAATAAKADTVLSGNIGVLSGNNVRIPITTNVPIKVCDTNVLTGVIAVGAGSLASLQMNTCPTNNARRSAKRRATRKHRRAA